MVRFAKGSPDAFLLLPQSAVEKAEEMSEVEARVLLTLAALLKSGPASEEDLCRALPQTKREEVLAALAFWRGCGVVQTDKTAPKAAKKAATPALPEKESPEETVPEKRDAARIDADEAPFYTALDLAEAAKKNPDFKNLVSFTEERLGKVLNTSELARLYSFLDYLNMPMSVVMIVIQDACDHEKRSLRYITKVLTSFQDEGIDTYEKAEAYYQRRKESAVYEKYVRSLFGLGDRKLTPTETKIIETWRTSFSYGEDMLDAAFEKTVASAKNPSVKYMHKILENWYLAGKKTPADLEKPDETRHEKAPKSYDLDDFFQAAVANGRKKL